MGNRFKHKTYSYKTFRKKKNTGKNLQGRGVVNGHDTKSTTHQRKSSVYLTFSTIRTWSEKIQVKRMKRQPTDWERELRSTHLTKDLYKENIENP